MINVLQKASRLAFGPSKDDSWLDILGYGENVAMLRPEQRNGRQSTVVDTTNERLLVLLVGDTYVPSGHGTIVMRWTLFGCPVVEEYPFLGVEKLVRKHGQWELHTTAGNIRYFSPQVEVSIRS